MKRTKPTAPSEIVRAHTGIVEGRSLSKTEKLLLDEAVALGTRAHKEAETALTDFGRWILLKVFNNDPAAALDDKRENRVWQELVERAGGPSLRLSRKVLYVTLQIVTHDKRISDDAWRILDAGRKEVLLPLREEGRLREAAQHVSAFKLTIPATVQYGFEAATADHAGFAAGGTRWISRTACCERTVSIRSPFGHVARKIEDTERAGTGCE
jgi:hypothetical protein